MSRLIIIGIRKMDSMDQVRKYSQMTGQIEKSLNN